LKDLELIILVNGPIKCAFKVYKSRLDETFFNNICYKNSTLPAIGQQIPVKIS